MHYHIDKSAAQSAYLQLYHQLRRDIVSGVYPLGTKMPSKRLIATETGVSVITVEHALAILCDEGYLESRERSGFFVSGGLLPGLRDGDRAPHDRFSRDGG